MLLKRHALDAHTARSKVNAPRTTSLRKPKLALTIRKQKSSSSLRKNLRLRVPTPFKPK